MEQDIGNMMSRGYLAVVAQRMNLVPTMKMFTGVQFNVHIVIGSR